MNTEKLKSWIRLIGTKNLGPVTFRQLIGRYGSALKALEMLPSIYSSLGKPPPLILDDDYAEKQLDLARSFRAKTITWESPEYPTQLKTIDSAPPVLYAIGNLDLLLKDSIAVVGARNASLNGMKFTTELCQSLGEAGVVVVSGLALGIDAAAHKGSLSTGTVAVVGGGLDTVYPQEHKELQDEIGQKGLLLSEFPFGVSPSAHHFPQRNRIISGLSKGVVVVKARHQSGSMITAKYAADFGRDVFAVPGFPYDPRSEGPNYLISDGAIMVRSSKDILNNLLSAGNGFALKEFNPKDFFPEPGPEVKSFHKMRESVMELLSTTPTSIDDVISHTGLSPAYVWDIILELELANKLERHGGNRISLKP